MTNRTIRLSATIAASALGLSAVAGMTAPQASAFSIGGHYDGFEFDALGLEVPWAAESRIGVSGAGDHELNIHDADNGAANRVQAEFEWVNGEAVDFSLAFDSVANTLTYVVDGITLSKTEIVEDSFSDMYIRSSARKDGTSMLVDNLFLTDASMAGAIADVSSASCSGGVGCGYGDADYLHITGIAGDFLLTGTSTMAWTGDKPQRSNLAYQIKLVEGEGGGETSVPEPTSAIAIGLVGLAAVARKRR